MNEQEKAFWGDIPQHTIDYANRVCVENRKRKQAMIPKQYTDLNDIDLRIEISKVLESIHDKISSEVYSVWMHDIDVTIVCEGADISTCTKCKKCHKDNVDMYAPCSIPNPANGSWADLADKLLRRVNKETLWIIARAYSHPGDTHIESLANGLLTFMLNMSRTRCCILLEALEQDKI